MSGTVRDGLPNTRARRGSVVTEIIDQVEARTEALGHRLLDRYREEIFDYRDLKDGAQANDVVATATHNLEILIAACRTDEPIDEDGLHYFRRSGARRAGQGVSVESLLRAYRLWGQVVWEEVLATISADQPHELEAALSIAGKIMAHVDAVSVVVTQGYLDELAGVWSDREVVRRDLLEALISGRVAGRPIRNANLLGLDPRASYAVILVRSAHQHLLGRERARDALEVTRSSLDAGDLAVLVGLREDEIVAIFPVATRSEADQPLLQATALAERLESFVVGVGRCNHGLEGIASSYHEAKEAAEIAYVTGALPPVAAFDQVLLAHILRTSPQAESLLEDTLSLIQAYDEARNANLVGTLAAYFGAGFHLTRAANSLHVHPNTVTYRLHRIHALTGRDPANPDDLLLLVLGLKLLELGDARA